MKSKHLLILLFILSSCSAQKRATSPYGQFTDKRDGHVYKTIKIGKRVWTAENLAFDGPGSEYYNNDDVNGPIYGKLYAFVALPQVAPKGWHVPSDQEWQQMEAVCVDPVKTLNIVYGGEFGTGKFRYLGQKATFFTTTHDGMPVITRYIDKGNTIISTNRQGIGWHLSVRCIKDED